MSDFIDKLNLAEKAAEDIYFAKVNRELIDALHKQMQDGDDPLQDSSRSSVKARTQDNQSDRKAAEKTG